MVLLIRDEDVKEAVRIEDIIEAVEEVYLQHGRGLVQDTPRREIRTKGKGLPHLAEGTAGVAQALAYLEEPKVVFIATYFGIPAFDIRSKAGSTRPGIMCLIDGSEGKTLAILSSRSGLYMRTGAAGAVGARYLGRRDSTTAGVIGTGVQGRGLLQCLTKVNSIEKVYAFSGRKRDETFAREMGRLLGIDVVAADGPEEVVRKADILNLATPSTEPVVRGEWVEEGTHINSMGADDPQKVELDSATLKKADKIVVDSEWALTKIGQIAIPLSRGILRPEDIHGLMGEVVAGLKPGREDDQEITIFSSEGSNMQSAGVAYKIYEKVKEKGLGVETTNLRHLFMI